MTPPPVAATVTQVGIGHQIAPAGLERLQLSGFAGDQFTQAGRAECGMADAAQRVDEPGGFNEQGCERGCHGANDASVRC